MSLWCFRRSRRGGRRLRIPTCRFVPRGRGPARPTVEQATSFRGSKPHHYTHRSQRIDLKIFRSNKHLRNFSDFEL